MTKRDLMLLRAHANSFREEAGRMRALFDEIMGRHEGTETEKLATLQASVISDAADLVCQAADSIEALTH